MDKDTKDFVTVVGWCNRDCCRVTMACRNLNATQTVIIDAIRNMQEVNENIPITYDMLEMYINTRKRKAIQRNAKILEELGIIKRIKTPKKPTTLSIDVNNLDSFLKENSPLYDEILTSDGLNWVENWNLKKAHLKETGLVPFSYFPDLIPDLTEQMGSKWLSEYT